MVKVLKYCRYCRYESITGSLLLHAQVHTFSNFLTFNAAVCVITAWHLRWRGWIHSVVN